eukprot:TRINITY_DN367_c0_g1_i2.p1 TRINITY_DN367_c0_g1~~TRINITY_DN367_c0_g1_i2.p1  ORF type:complete len:180 (+),score=26.10 TRINITY_DN367_c0_g1_i2:184-723(+)
MRISAIPTVTPLNLFSYHCGSKTCLVSSISFNQTTRVRVSNALNEETGMPDENADTDLRTRETLQIETVEERKGLRKRTKPRRKHKAASVSLSSETETKKESSKEKSLLQKAVEIYLGEKDLLALLLDCITSKALSWNLRRRSVMTFDLIVCASENSKSLFNRDSSKNYSVLMAVKYEG